jgi:hypothetical protein
MRNIVLIKTDGDHQVVRDLLLTTEHVKEEGSHWVHMDGGWTAVSVRFHAPHAVDHLEARGAIVWPHSLEHDEVMQDHHHKEKVPPEIGIVSGDTPHQAAKKLAKGLSHVFDPRVF